MTDASGTTRYRYDHRGNLVERQQLIASSPAFSLRYGYDLADRIVQILYPSGRIVDYARDAQGRVQSVSTRASAGSAVQPLLSGATYEAFGALTAATLGNGQTLEQAWSADGRLTARRLRQGAALLHGLAYAYDNDDNPTSIIDEVDASASLTFAYDAAARLARVDRATGALRREDYAHDANGNRIERRALPGDAGAARPQNGSVVTRLCGR